MTEEPEAEPQRHPQISEQEIAYFREQAAHWSQQVARQDALLEGSAQISEAVDRAIEGLRGLSIAAALDSVREADARATRRIMGDTRKLAKTFHLLGDPDTPAEERQRLYEQFLDPEQPL